MQPRHSASRSLLIVAQPYLVDSAKGGASDRYVSLLQAGADRLYVAQFICAMAPILIVMWKTSQVCKNLREKLGSLSFEDIEV